jgi:hypothetical protein
MQMAKPGRAPNGAAPDPIVSTFAPSDAQVLNLLARAPLAAAEMKPERTARDFSRRIANCCIEFVRFDRFGERMR